MNFGKKQMIAHSLHLIAIVKLPPIYRDDRKHGYCEDSTTLTADSPWSKKER